MSVNRETLSAHSSVISPAKEAPEIEYTLVQNDSLAMFLAAIGGAILGMLLTLLVLAIANGGTISFGSSERVGALESNVARINDNVGAVSANIDIVADQVGIVAATLDTARGDITNTGEALEALDITRQRFDTFVGALSEAMTVMESIAGDGEAEAVVAAEAAAATTAEVTVALPVVAHSADVAGDAIAVLLFADGNGNGTLDGGEALEAGVMATLLDDHGAAVASAETSDAGAMFEALHDGTYMVRIDGMDDIEVVVDTHAAEGAVVFVPVAGE